MSHDTDKICICVANHNPNPMELHRHHIRPLANGGAESDENTIWLCPTAHVNVHELMRHWFKVSGRPDWEIERTFSIFVRKLARLGYEMSLAPEVNA